MGAGEGRSPQPEKREQENQTPWTIGKKGRQAALGWTSLIKGTKVVMGWILGSRGS